MLHYIIDGNNLIGKIKHFSSLQKKDKQSTREKLVFYLERYFSSKKAQVTLHFDGFANLPINSQKIKIIYSENKIADQKIKQQIEKSKTPRNLIVVSSDNNIKEFARVCSAKTLSSEDFALEIQKEKNVNEESERIKEINNVEEFKRIFNVK